MPNWASFLKVNLPSCHKSTTSCPRWIGDRLPSISQDTGRVVARFSHAVSHDPCRKPGRIDPVRKCRRRGVECRLHPCRVASAAGEILSQVSRVVYDASALNSGNRESGRGRRRQRLCPVKHRPFRGGFDVQVGQKGDEAKRRIQ